MKTKKLSISILGLLIGLFAFVQPTKALTYHYCGVGAVTNLNSWWVNSNCTGAHPASFTAASHTWNFVGGISYSLSGNFSIRGGSTVNIGTALLSASVTTNGFSIKRTAGAGNITLNVQVTGQLIVTTNNLFAGGNFLVLGACSSGSNVTYNLAGATVGSGTYDNLTISADASLNGNAIDINNAFDNSAIFSIGSGGYLGIAGTMTGVGTVSGDIGGTINFYGSTTETLNMDQTTPGTTNVMGYVSNSGTGTLQIGNALLITPGGDITPFSGTIDASTGSVTLLADQSGAYTTGAIGDMTSGAFVGNITSQVFHDPAGHITDWTMMGTPGINSPANIFSAWNNNFVITCANCPDGSTAGGTTFTSISFWDEPTSGYVDLVNITDALNPGVGVWVYAGQTSPGTSTSGELISVTGSPVSGNVPQNITGSGSGYNLLANPYPCPISWTSLYNNGNTGIIGSNYYVWSPNMAAYSQCDDQGVSSPAAGSYMVGDAIPTGQAFLVQANGAGGMMNFDEVVKLVGASQAILRTGNSQTTAVTKPTHFNIKASGNGMTAETAIKFVSGATTGYEISKDGLFYPGNAGSLQMSTVMGGYAYGINGMPDLNQNYSIPLRVTTATTTVCAFSSPNLQYMPAGACIMLHDNYTNTDYDLRNGPHNITINDSETVARFVVNITITTSTITANQSQATCPAGGDAFLTALGSGSGPWNYTWKNANNTIVKTSTNKATLDSLTGLTSGVYIVDVNTVGTCDNASYTYTLTVPAGISSAFSVNSNTVLVNNSLNFTDNSSNADAWFWDFADGNTSTQQNPVYTYTTTGTFDVNLYAINTACGDTVVSAFTTIDVLGATGIAHYTTNSIVVSKDEVGAFVKFNYTSQARVNITVYNAIGQVVLSNNALQVTDNKVYLDLNRAKNQILFISVTNFDESTQVTKKLFND